MSKAALVDHQAFDIADKIQKFLPDLRNLGFVRAENHPPAVHSNCSAGNAGSRD